MRIKGILNELITNTSKSRTPNTIFEFMQRISQNGKFIPVEWLLPIEKKYLTFTSNGKLV